MKTPNVYCATCSRPLGPGRQEKYRRFFCGDYCERVWPGRLGARNAVIYALHYGAMLDAASIARRYGLSRQAVEAIIKGK